MKRLLLMALAAAMLTPACGNNAGKETKAEVTGECSRTSQCYSSD